MQSDQSKVVYENIQNLLSDNKELKLSSLRQLNKIVQALGPERTRLELFPYMQEVLDDDEEVLLVLCDSLISLPLDFSNIRVFSWFLLSGSPGLANFVNWLIFRLG